jgi:hypothetical protein
VSRRPGRSGRPGPVAGSGRRVATAAARPARRAGRPGTGRPGWPYRGTGAGGCGCTRPARRPPPPRHCHPSGEAGVSPISRSWTAGCRLRADHLVKRECGGEERRDREIEAIAAATATLASTAMPRISARRTGSRPSGDSPPRLSITANIAVPGICASEVASTARDRTEETARVAERVAKAVNTDGRRRTATAPSTRRRVPRSRLAGSWQCGVTTASAWIVGLGTRWGPHVVPDAERVVAFDMSSHCHDRA